MKDRTLPRDVGAVAGATRVVGRGDLLVTGAHYTARLVVHRSQAHRARRPLRRR